MNRNSIFFSVLTLLLLSGCKVEIINPSVNVDEGAVTVEDGALEDGFVEPVEAETGKPAGFAVSDAEGNFIGRRVTDISADGDFTLAFPGGGEVTMNTKSDKVKAVVRKDLVLLFTGANCHLGELDKGDVLSSAPIEKSVFVTTTREDKTSIFLVLTKEEVPLPRIATILKDGDDVGHYTCSAAPAVDASQPVPDAKTYRVGTMRLNFPYPFKLPLNAGP